MNPIMDRPDPRHGEVWNVVLDPVKGHEQGGIRPALVISNDRFNRAFETLFIIVPFTRTDRGIPSQLRVLPPEGGLSAPSLVMCEQIRAVSISRFRKRRGELSSERIHQVEQTIPRLITAPRWSDL
jgi:mRNA interferase MazF